LLFYRTNILKSFLTLFLVLAGIQLQAAIRYVSLTGNNTTGDGSIGNPWRTPGGIQAQLSPGDIVVLRNGNFRGDGAQTLSTSGTAGNFITYVSESVWGAQLQNIVVTGDYVRLAFLDLNRGGFLNNSSCIDVSNADNIEIWHCKTRQADNQIRHLTANNILMIGNDHGWDGTDETTEMDNITFGHGSNILISHATVHDFYEDVFQVFGTGIIVQNYYVHNPRGWEFGPFHTDVQQTGSTTTFNVFHYLVRSGFYVDTSAASDMHWWNYSNDPLNDSAGPMQHHRNVVVGLGSGSTIHNGNWDLDGIFFVNDTYYQAQRAADATTVRYGVATGGTPANVGIFNSIFVDWWGPSATSLEGYQFSSAPSFFHDGNLAWDSSRSPNAGLWNANALYLGGQTNGCVDCNPMFVDAANTNFLIGASSGARSQGRPITAVTSASGTGTSFDVGEARWMHAPNSVFGNFDFGTVITIGTDVRRVTGISGNTVTVDSAVTWTQYDEVFFGDSTTPDIGAYPYGHVKLTAATYAVEGGTATVTPVGDAFVTVKFRNLVPVTIDNSSPFSFSDHQDGDSYRVYAAYASDTPWVLAAAGDPPAPESAGTAAGSGAVFSQGVIAR
jgi:hypothetical protein